MVFDLSRLDRLLDSQRADRSPGCPEETLESAGCTGSCQSFKDGLPNCEDCSQATLETMRSHNVQITPSLFGLECFMFDMKYGRRRGKSNGE